MKIETVSYNKLRQGILGTFKKAKSFLEKGRGIKLGTCPDSPNCHVKTFDDPNQILYETKANLIQLKS